MSLLSEKRIQATQVAAELGIDLWMICDRETKMQADPAIDLVIGREVTWQSFFLFTPKGDRIALIGSLDAANFENDDYTEVVTFDKGVGEDLHSLLKKINPETIAINFSEDDPAADGLTVGMFHLLEKYLGSTPYIERFVSAEDLIGKLRSRKLPAEIDRLEKAANLATDVWDKAEASIKAGMTEIEIAQLIDKLIAEYGCTPSFDTIANAGDKTNPGHGLPTNAKLQPGDLLHVDFGIKYDGYCSDIQRLFYLLRPGEDSPPAELIDAFNCVREIITETAKEALPGAKGHQIDAIARETLINNGYPEYQHALGHQLGRDVHDGGAIIGPNWERYGRTPGIIIEEHNVFTLELEIQLPGIGCVGLEEDVHITNNGARFLGKRQMELVTT